METLEQRYQELLKNNVRLQDVFGRIAIGDELQMTEPFLEAMTLVSAAKTLKQGSSSLFLGQCFATVGIDSETSTSGFVGPVINRLVDLLSEALLSELIFTKKPTIGNAMLLKRIVKGTLIFSVGFGKVLNLKIKQGAENESSKISIRLTLLLVASSSILKKTFKELMRSCGGDEKASNMGSEILSLVSLLLVGFRAQGESRDFSALIEVLNSYFKRSLEKIDELISIGFAEHKVDPVRASAIHAAITQANLSLNQKNSEDFLQALRSALEAIEISNADFDKDILEMENVIESVCNILSQDMAEISMSATEISVLA